MIRNLFAAVLLTQLSFVAALPSLAQAGEASAKKEAKKAEAEQPRTPERFLAIAEKLKEGGKYEPKNGSTFCNFFARDFVKELLGKPLPELNGQANEQLTKMA